MGYRDLSDRWVEPLGYKDLSIMWVEPLGYRDLSDKWVESWDTGTSVTGGQNHGIQGPQ